MGDSAIAQLAEVVRKAPLTRFGQLVRLTEPNLLRVVIVSPWIVTAEPHLPPLIQIVAAAQSSKARLTVLTRKPDKVRHQDAIDYIATVEGAEILFHNSLHAKLYLLEANGLRVAMMGSPNFTPEGDALHRELAIQVRSTREGDAADALVKDLFLFAREIMADGNAHFYKRVGDRAR